jgi:hypothetical protein
MIAERMERATVRIRTRDLRRSLSVRSRSGRHFLRMLLILFTSQAGEEVPPCLGTAFASPATVAPGTEPLHRTKTAREEGPMMVANERTELEARVIRRLRGQVREFQLVVTDGGLILRGRCRTYYVKQLVQHAVMEDSDRPILANEIEVT